MKQHQLRVRLFCLAVSMILVSCATHLPGEAITAKVANSVGKRFAETNHSRPTGAVTRILKDDGKLREYEYQWENGCAYALLVEIQSDVILSWRYTSNPEPCLKVTLHTFGT
jgi:hypothetical protein